jgi:hypothetical protein
MQRTANLINALGTIVFTICVAASFFQLGGNLDDLGADPTVIDLVSTIDSHTTPAALPGGCTQMSFNPCADLDTSRIDDLR